MNTWTRELQGLGSAVTDNGYIMEDKFTKLWSNKTLEPAKVAMTVSESEEYGARKVSATVSLACNQNKEAIDEAGMLAFFTALELVRDGWDELRRKG